MHEGRVWEEEHGTFTPVVFSCTGEMGLIYKHIHIKKSAYEMSSQKNSAFDFF